MTMIDEGVLSDALRDIAESIDLSDGAVERILGQLQPSATESKVSEVPNVIRHTPRRRVLMTVAVVTLLAGGITAAVANIPNDNTPSSSAPLAAPDHSSASKTPASGSGALRSSASGSVGLPGTPPKSAPPSKSDSSIPPGAVGQSAKVEANGSVDLTIGDGTLQSVLGKLTILASAEGGFVASTQAQLGPAKAGSSSSGVVVLRVPEANFGSLVTQVQRDGKPTSVTTTSEDVTGQYVNLQARIAALQSSRQQYLTIMTRASSIGDILAVQSQLDTLQGEIDQLQGQLNVLDNETTYGSLTVSLSEVGKTPPPPPRPHPPASGLLRAWDKSVGGFVSGIEWIIRIAGPLLLVLICLAALLFLGRLSWRTVRRRTL